MRPEQASTPPPSSKEDKWPGAMLLAALGSTSASIKQEQPPLSPRDEKWPAAMLLNALPSASVLRTPSPGPAIKQEPLSCGSCSCLCITSSHLPHWPPFPPFTLPNRETWPGQGPVNWACQKWHYLPVAVETPCPGAASLFGADEGPLVDLEKWEEGRGEVDEREVRKAIGRRKRNRGEEDGKESPAVKRLRAMLKRKEVEVKVVEDEEKDNEDDQDAFWSDD